MENEMETLAVEGSGSYATLWVLPTTLGYVDLRFRLGTAPTQ